MRPLFQSINTIDVTSVTLSRWLNVECSNVPMFQCSNVQRFNYSNVQMFQCSNVPMFQCSSIPMFKCSNVTERLWKKCVSSKSAPNHLLMFSNVVSSQKWGKMKQIQTFFLCWKLFTGGSWAGFRPIFLAEEISFFNNTAIYLHFLYS